MMKAVWSGAATAAAVVFLSAPAAFAQATAPGSLGVTANVAAKAKLTLGVGSFTFADADPDATATMTSSAVSVAVNARTSPTGAVTLTVLASGDLDSGSATIAINNLTWTSTGAGFQPGTSNKTTAQTVGGWTGSGSRTGGQTFSLPNSWTYATGTYTVTLNYTLTSP